jgi:hypothetical protein
MGGSPQIAPVKSRWCAAFRLICSSMVLVGRSIRCVIGTFTRLLPQYLNLASTAAALLPSATAMSAQVAPWRFMRTAYWSSFIDHDTPLAIQCSTDWRRFLCAFRDYTGSRPRSLYGCSPHRLGHSGNSTADHTFFDGMIRIPWPRRRTSDVVSVCCSIRIANEVGQARSCGPVGETRQFRSRGLRASATERR